MPVLNDADSFKVGSSQVDKIYMGTNEVWVDYIPPTYNGSAYASARQDVLTVSTSTLGASNGDFLIIHEFAEDGGNSSGNSASISNVSGYSTVWSNDLHGDTIVDVWQSITILQLPASGTLPSNLQISGLCPAGDTGFDWAIHVHCITANNLVSISSEPLGSRSYTQVNTPSSSVAVTTLSGSCNVGDFVLHGWISDKRVSYNSPLSGSSDLDTSSGYFFFDTPISSHYYEAFLYQTSGTSFSTYFDDGGGSEVTGDGFILLARRFRFT
jgi:hypothetical protein